MMEPIDVPINEASLAVLETKINQIEHDLYGNGQPGALQRVNDRLDKIDDKIGRVMVAIALMAGGSGAVAGAVIKTLLGS